MATLSAENEISLLSHTRFYWHSNWQLNFGSQSSRQPATTSNNTDDINSNSNININSKPQQLATVESSTTTILSALKRCNYFMPDNNLILSMPQNVQVPI